jgi:hypothetical protein
MHPPTGAQFCTQAGSHSARHVGKSSTHCVSFVPPDAHVKTHWMALDCVVVVVEVVVVVVVAQPPGEGHRQLPFLQANASLQVLPSQHGWPSRPQARHVPFLQANPLPQTLPPQQISPPPPHAVQTPFLQVSPDAQQVPLHGVAQTQVPVLPQVRPSQHGEVALHAAPEAPHAGGGAQTHGKLVQVQTSPAGQQRGMPVPCPPHLCAAGQQLSGPAQNVPVGQQSAVWSAWKQQGWSAAQQTPPGRGGPPPGRVTVQPTGAGEDAPQQTPPAQVPKQHSNPSVHAPPSGVHWG